MLDVNKIKLDFPVLERTINGQPLVYLDNAATSQKPKQVIKAVSDYYEKHNANVHRGIHTLSEEASDLYEEARKNVSGFLGAVRPKELVFTSGSTESLNLIAFGWGLKNLKKGEGILLSEEEHHSNLVPWQIVAEKTGAELNLLPTAQVEHSEFMSLLKDNINDRVKIISIPHASNVTAAIKPIRDVVKEAKKVNAYVCVDGAQAAPHMDVNVQSLGCDFYVVSGHKMLGPTGVGALWAKEELLEDMEPVLYGGGMIKEVYEKEANWMQIPEKFEPGTPNIAGVVGFSAAVDYLRKVGMKDIRAHEISLNAYALEKLQEIDKLSLIGPKKAEQRTGLVSFVVKNVHSHDIAAVLDTEGVAVRSGHHCAMPLHNNLKVTASTRASYYLYNSKEDIDKLVSGVKKAISILL